MKTLTKLALVSAMAFSANAMAAQLQSLDDAELSATTGQDGITITLGNEISMDYLAIVDTDGGPAALGTAPNDIATGLNSEAAAIVIGGANGLKITPNQNIVVKVDADANADKPLLNIGIDMGDTDIEVGSIRVATVEGDLTGATLGAAADGKDVAILDIGTVTLNGLLTNIQLGNNAQGAMIKLKTEIAGGLQLSDVSLVGKTLDASSPEVALGAPTGKYGIGLGAVGVTTTGQTSLNLDLDISATVNGMTIDGLTSMDISADNLRIGHLAGGAQKMGNLYIKNLNMGSSITIAGH